MVSRRTLLFRARQTLPSLRPPQVASSRRTREDRAMPVYFYDPPDRFVAGAVGQPGERIFYLQATSSGRVTSVVLEKFQVSLLAERLDELLDEVLSRTGGSPQGPAAGPAGLRERG